MRSREVRRLGVVDITDPLSMFPSYSREPIVEEEAPPAAPKQPLVGREAPSARRQTDPEEIVRGVASLDPYLETIDDELFCAFCDARGGTHTGDCVWLMADLWARRNTP